MTRPAYTPLQHAMQGWDADANDNFDLVFTTPLPLAEVANFAALPAAASYAECIAVLADEKIMVISNGTVWKRIGTRAVDPGDSVAITLGALVADYNTLLANLRTTKLIG